MDARTRAELAQALRRRRGTLLKQFLDAEAGLRSIAEDRESELEERAQEDRTARVLARLDDQSVREIADIDAALWRVIDGTYGTCLDCGRAIPLARLRAVPSTELCIACAREQATAATPPAAMEPRHPGALPADLEPLLDREVEEVLREFVRENRGIDTEELRILCRHGVVHLEGAVPSEGEHKMLLGLVTDVAGCEEVVDHVRVDELAWERPDRSRTAPRERVRPARFEPVGTEDVVESTEDGLDYVPPDRPTPDEE
jgi:RNA polymerase-binding transcription factor DksA